MTKPAVKKTTAKKKAAKKQPEERFEQVAEEIPESPPNQAVPMKVGYLVAISSSGEFVFEVFGEEQGLVEVMGLHQFAGLKINQILDAKQMTGDALVNEVGKAVQSLHIKFDKLNSPDSE